MESLNRNPGKKARKKMVTFGLSTFIQKPFLNKANNCNEVVSPCESSIPQPCLKTINAKYNKYAAPNNLITQNSVSLRFMISDTPKANKVVCTKQPVIRPPTTARPNFLPFDMLKVSTKILSGPGEMAKAEVAKIKPMRML